ncbi:hypothetical protein [Antrihabitans sp. YC2-6]|uniref:hypothetical protein n=1 Tax=Antrihabitans sp. YC2-6 TaxID=2799498 RepID=UPI0018F35C27|nr:hypothetical protein [Antrihabitans sp. YC2-6]MBJ8343716.1 hypothetical protein [Antrihabitans sp. YC2-6]
MGIRVQVGVGPLQWSRPIRIPRAQRNALNLIGSLLYLVLLAALWLGYALALLNSWRFALVLFVAIGVVLGGGLWWLGRRAWEQWGVGLVAGRG